MNYEKALAFVRHSEYAKWATHQDENPINEHDCAVLICECCEKFETEIAEARAEIERLKLTTGELTGVFNARPKCEKCERKDQLIEQMRKALRAWTRTPNIPLHEAIKITNAALEAVEGIDNRAE